MSITNKKWLPHLEDSIPIEARGYSVSMYSIALEGWRRGLTLTFSNKRRRRSELIYSLADENKEHTFTVSRGDLTSNEAREICRNKHLTKEYLLAKNVSTPTGEVFQKNTSDQTILEYAKTQGFPCVIKPSDGTGGAGVIANIKTEKEFIEALEYVRYNLKYPEVIVEKFFEGEDYRVYVVGEKVIGAFIRIPANVIGDGRSDVRELLKKKMVERDKNPALFKRKIKIDKEMHNMLREKGYTLDSVPSEGERVILKSKNNVSSGGDPIDVTSDLTEEIKEIALNATKAIPGLANAGVDIMVDEKKNTGVVLEINSQASIRSHLFPMEGRARDIPKAIIDYYFPETKSANEPPLYYFDLGNVFKSIQNGIDKEIVVPAAPTGKLSSTRFVVSGDVQEASYEKWVRIQALNLNLNGHIKQLKNGDASVVISGSVKSIDLFREILKNKAPEKSNVIKVLEKNRTSPVKIGFEITSIDIGESSISSKDGYYPVRIRDKSRNNKKRKSKSKSRKSYKALVDEKNMYKKKYKAITNSRSWKITSPLRKIGSILEGILK